MRDSKMVGAGTDEESIVDCGTFDPMGGGIFQFGLVLVASSTAVIERLWSKFDFISLTQVSNPRLSVQESTLTTPAPNPTSASFAKNLNAIVVSFDRNIQAKEPKLSSCDGIFTADTLGLLGESPSCSVKADEVVITLGDGLSVKFSDELTLAPGNGITELQSEPEYSSEALGSVVVSPPSDLASLLPSFSISAPAQICAEGSFPVTVGDLQV